MKKSQLQILLSIIKSTFILLLVIGTICIITWIGWSFYNDVFATLSDVVVPSVINISKSEAKAKIEKSGLVIEFLEERNETVAKDIVISQKPEPGRKVKSGRKVVVIVSLGGEFINIPDLKGMSSRDAEEKVKALGLNYLILEEVYHDTILPGKIIDQKPSPSTSVKKNSTVKVILSKGPNILTDVPDVTGIDIRDGRKIIEEKGFVIDRIVWIEDSNFNTGMIRSQMPLPGEKIPSNSFISLEVIGAKSPDNNAFFKQELVSLNIPSAQKEIKVEMFLTDNSGKSRIYNAYHRGGDKIELCVSSIDGRMVEIYFDGIFNSKIDL